MIAVRRLLVLPILLGAVLAFSALAAAPPTAQANNCQVEQLPGLPPLMPESDDPRCIVQKSLGCPNLQDTAGCVGGVRTYVLSRSQIVGTAVEKLCLITPSLCYLNP